MTGTKLKMPNYWVITKDYDPTKGAAPGTNGNAKGLRSHKKLPEDVFARLTLPFRLLDDDGNIYYKGTMVPFDEHDEYANGFEPLDAFGGPNAGCTSLEFFDTNAHCWRQL